MFVGCFPPGTPFVIEMYAKHKNKKGAANGQFVGSFSR